MARLSESMKWRTLQSETTEPGLATVVDIDAVGNVAVRDDKARDSKAVGVNAIANVAVGDDAVRVVEAVRVDAVGNVAIGDDGVKVG